MKKLMIYRKPGRRQKKKYYKISFYADNTKFILQLIDIKQGEYYQAVFSEDGMHEKGIRVCKKFLKYKANPNYRVYVDFIELPEYKRKYIHNIFPYVPVYRKFEEFYCLYQRYCNVYPQDVLQSLKKFYKDLICTAGIPDDGIWRSICHHGKSYLFCKWIDAKGNIHAVLMDNIIYISDLNYVQICEQENGWNVRCMDLEMFLSEHPEAMLKTYLEKGGKKVFQFLTSRIMNHPLELLGKAGLSKLADHLEKCEGIFLDGKNLRDIFGLPMQVLRSLEQGEHTMLYTSEDRSYLIQAYQEAPEIFQNPMSIITELWIRYYYCRNQKKIFQHRLNDKHKLGDTIRYLNGYVKKQMTEYDLFVMYQNYIMCSIKTGVYLYGFYPKNLQKARIDTLVLLQKKCDEQDNLQDEEKYKTIINKRDYRMLYDNVPDCKYRIVISDSPDALYSAGKKLHNCIGKSYLKKIVYEGCKILLIEDKENQKLIGAIEVCGDFIIQAWGICNRPLSDEVSAYVKNYAGRKGLHDFTTFINDTLAVELAVLRHL